MSTALTVPGFTRRRLTVVLGALMLAVLLASLETSIIATALPTITGEFDAFESYAWVGTAYIVTSAIGTPLIGKLSDLYGRRQIFQMTMAIFVVGSILCGASQSMTQLIGARAFQGLGGGGIQALAFAILGDILPARERGRYVGYFTLAFVGSALLGPLLGGFIIENFSWPWIFYINIPFALVVSLICHFALRLPFHRREAKLDYAGAALLSISIGSLMIGLEEGRDGWTDQHVLLLFGAAAAALALFIAVEQRAQEPMIPLRLFTNRIVLCCFLLGMCAGVVTYGAAQFLPLYFQDSLFVSPTQSGLRMLPQMIGVTAATFGIGRLIAKTGRYKPFPIIGSTVSVVGLLGVAQITGTTPYWWLVVPMIFMGFGAASVFTTTSIASQNAVPFGDLGVATATVHVLPLARRFARPGHLRHRPQRHRPHRDPGRHRRAPRRGGRADPVPQGDRRPAPRRPPGRRRQRRPRRQPRLPDLRRRDGLRHPHRHPAARAPPADAGRALRRDGGRRRRRLPRCDDPVPGQEAGRTRGRVRRPRARRTAPASPSRRAGRRDRRRGSPCSSTDPRSARRSR